MKLSLLNVTGQYARAALLSLSGSILLLLSGAAAFAQTTVYDAGKTLIAYEAARQANPDLPVSAIIGQFSYGYYLDDGTFQTYPLSWHTLLENGAPGWTGNEYLSPLALVNPSPTDNLWFEWSAVLRPLEMMVHSGGPSPESPDRNVVRWTAPSGGTALVTATWAPRSWAQIVVNTEIMLNGVSEYSGDSSTLPTTADQCKNGGWQSYGVFKNQGDCVSFVATGGKNPPAK